MKKEGLAHLSQPPFLFYGWGTRSRTSIRGVRVRRPTIERSPIVQVRSSEWGVRSLKSKFKLHDIIKRLVNQS